MLYPTIKELSDEGVNRYMLSIATAKCARIITDEQLEKAQLVAQEIKDDKFSAYKKQAPSEKPVKEAINRLYTRDFKIIPAEEANED